MNIEPQSLDELTNLVGGRLVGDGTQCIQSAATLEKADAGDITFLANRKYAPLLKNTAATAVVVSQPVDTPATQIIAEDPYYAFTRIVIRLYGHRRHPIRNISQNAAIARSAIVGEGSHIADFVSLSENVRIGRHCTLYPNVFIGPNTEIGDHCVLYPNVAVYENCRIGHRVIIQANATVGEDGFGFATHQGAHHKIPHIGRVIIEDDVEIGAGCGIERGTLDDTIIGPGTKIGDLVAIGHGTRVGRGCLLVAQVGIAGSTEVGDYCQIGGQAGIAGHLKIGSRVGIAAKSGVHRNIPNGQVVFGVPAFEIKKAREAHTILKSLPEMRRHLKALEQRVAELEKQK